MKTPPTVRCPQCGAAVEWSPESRWRPFCSERCKMVDLGAWASGAYRIAAEHAEDDESAGASEDAADPA